MWVIRWENQIQGRLMRYSQEIANYHFGGHKCLDLETVSRQELGGPTHAGEDIQCRWPTGMFFFWESDS